MNDKLFGVVWRLTAFVVACLFFAGAMFAIFAQLRFQKEVSYSATFADVSGLEEGQFVRIAGVEVGKIKKLKLNPDTTVDVVFGTDISVVLTRGTRAVIRYADLIGGRYLALEDGAGDASRLRPGETIPLSNTSPALDLDALIGGFRPLFRALDPDQVNALSSQLIAVFEGQGGTIGSFFEHTAALTSALADRSKLIGEVIVNLNTVLGTLGDQNTQFAKGIDSLVQLVTTLADRRQDVSNSVTYADAAATALASLLGQARPPLQNVVHETDRAAGIAVADHDYLDNLLATLPDAYQALGRQALYGDYFGFYLCDILLKVNGKGGQPVYIKVAGQPSGRCTPK